MILLDTNVLSALMRRTSDAGVIAWLDRQPRTSVWTTSITILEVRFGLQVMPAGKRRSVLMELFERVLTEKIERRVASLTRRPRSTQPSSWRFDRRTAVPGNCAMP